MFSFNSKIEKQFHDAIRVHRELADQATAAIGLAAELIIRTLRSGGMILVCGNGGSASDSQHFAAELVGRFRKNRKGLPVLSLTTDTSILTAVGNDYGFDNVFRRQVEAFGGSGDLLVGLSTSGNSNNVVQAMDQARELGMKTIAMTGGNGGPIADQADVNISVPSNHTARIQEGHGTVIHIICELVESALFSQNENP